MSCADITIGMKTAGCKTWASRGPDRDCCGPGGVAAGAACPVGGAQVLAWPHPRLCLRQVLPTGNSSECNG